MNEQSGDSRNRLRRPQFRRAGVLPTAVAGLALLVAACGGSAAGSAASSGSGYQQALAFTHCMRSHGEPGFPDPVKEAGDTVAFQIASASGIHTNSAQYQSAYGACHQLLPSGRHQLLPSGRTGIAPGLRQKVIAATLKYSACMRSHGIANFPDPVSNGKGISIPPMHGVNPQSQQFQSAEKACRSLLPRITAAG
jgi:hypothetical protein